MSTTFLVAQAELSRQIGDYWSSATTSDGSTTPFITMKDAALKAKENDWINKDTWVMLTEEPTGGTTSLYDERKVVSLSNTNGTLTVAAFTERIVSGIDYEIHRLFKPGDKKDALIYAARTSFPDIHEKIWDESMVSGNWLKDGSFEIWTSSSALTHWTTDTSTITETTSSPYYKHGATSCKLGTAAGKISQSISNWDDLKRLAGKNVTFTVQGFCATASTLRIAIYDGTTTTYSDYRTAESAWTEDSDPLEVTATIQDNPTAIEFHILLDTANDAYVDDARVIWGTSKPRLFIETLGLAQEEPIRIYIEPSDYSTGEPWILLHEAKLDTELGYLYLPTGISNDFRLRITGMGYLDFLLSGSSSTSWTAAININSPQTDILIAQAILYLYTRMSLPNFTAGDRKDFQEAMGFWRNELRERINKHGMPIAPIPVSWR